MTNPPAHFVILTLPLPKCSLTGLSYIAVFIAQTTQNKKLILKAVILVTEARNLFVFNFSKCPLVEASQNKSKPL